MGNGWILKDLTSGFFYKFESGLMYKQINWILFNRFVYKTSY